jgi:hypothetical protein
MDNVAYVVGNIDDGFGLVPSDADTRDEFDDTLNDETFGDIGPLSDDWEKSHELLAQTHEDFLSRNRLRDDYSPSLNHAHDSTLEHYYDDELQEETFFSLNSPPRHYHPHEDYRLQPSRDVSGFSSALPTDDDFGSSLRGLGQPLDDQLESMFNMVLEDQDDIEHESLKYYSNRTPATADRTTLTDRFGSQLPHIPYSTLSASPIEISLAESPSQKSIWASRSSTNHHVGVSMWGSSPPTSSSSGEVSASASGPTSTNANFNPLEKLLVSPAPNVSHDIPTSTPPQPIPNRIKGVFSLEELEARFNQPSQSQSQQPQSTQIQSQPQPLHPSQQPQPIPLGVKPFPGPTHAPPGMKMGMGMGMGMNNNVNPMLMNMGPLPAHPALGVRLPFPPNANVPGPHTVPIAPTMPSANNVCDTNVNMANTGAAQVPQMHVLHQQNLHGHHQYQHQRQHQHPHQHQPRQITLGDMMPSNMFSRPRSSSNPKAPNLGAGNKRWIEVKAMMSAEEIDSIIRLQNAQLHSNHPYIDDYYYYQLHNKKNAAPLLSDDVPQDIIHFHKPLCESTPTRTFPPKKIINDPLAGVLGRIPTHSVRAPRPLLQLIRGQSEGYTQSDSGATEQEQEEMEGVEQKDGGDKDKDREIRPPHIHHTVMLTIENAFNNLLDVEDIDLILAAGGQNPANANVNISHLLHKREIISAELLKSLHIDGYPLTKSVAPQPSQSQGVTLSASLKLPPVCPEDEFFVGICLIGKGRKLMARALRVFSRNFALPILLSFMRNVLFLLQLPNSDGMDRVFARLTQLVNVIAIPHLLVAFHTLLQFHPGAMLGRLVGYPRGAALTIAFLHRGLDLQVSLPMPFPMPTADGHTQLSYPLGAWRTLFSEMYTRLGGLGLIPSLPPSLLLAIAQCSDDRQRRTLSATITATMGPTWGLEGDISVNGNSNSGGDNATQQQDWRALRIFLDRPA